MRTINMYYDDSKNKIIIDGNRNNMAKMFERLDGEMIPIKENRKILGEIIINLGDIEIVIEKRIGFIITGFIENEEAKND